MIRLKVFVSSVPKEMENERQAIQAYLRDDPLLRRFFDVFLFEDLPAADRRADAVYLEKVGTCHIYLALLGNEYGSEDESGLSPTHREFCEATCLGKHRLVFVKGADDSKRHPKMRALIAEAGAQLIRRRFRSTEELLPSIYANLVDFLAARQWIRFGPFDATPCADATMDDLSTENIQLFLEIARRARGFPLSEDMPPALILEHLNLLKNGGPTNAAVLLFGKDPQRFLISSEVKCAHFHGTDVQKPIPFYRVYKGTAFDIVDQAVDFVLSKINLAVGTRAWSTQAPVAYEMPPEVVREAIVNAVAHRDYTSNGSVQVMLFSDRLEVWNPGTLPPTLTLEKLRQPHGSVPGNPLLAESLYLTKYIERMGTGIGDMIQRCKNFGLPEPEFALTDGFVTTIRRRPELALQAVSGTGTPQVGTKLALSRHQVRILEKCIEETALLELMAISGRSDRTKFRQQVLNPLLMDGLIEMTVPDKPRSSLQKYRLTDKGRTWLAGERS